MKNSKIILTLTILTMVLFTIVFPYTVNLASAYDPETDNVIFSDNLLNSAAGVNDVMSFEYGINSQGEPYSIITLTKISDIYRFSDYIPIQLYKDQPYTISILGSLLETSYWAFPQLQFYDSNKVALGNLVFSKNYKSYTFTPANDVYFIRFYLEQSDSDGSVNTIYNLRINAGSESLLYDHYADSNTYYDLGYNDGINNSLFLFSSFYPTTDSYEITSPNHCSAVYSNKFPISDIISILGTGDSIDFYLSYADSQWASEIYATLYFYKSDGTYKQYEFAEGNALHDSITNGPFERILRLDGLTADKLSSYSYAVVRVYLVGPDIYFNYTTGHCNFSKFFVTVQTEGFENTIIPMVNDRFDYFKEAFMNDFSFDNLFGWVDGLWNILSIPLFGNISIGALLAVPIVFSVLFLILKFIRG